MFKMFFPDEYLESTYRINFEELYRKGYRGIIFDIDNTLVPHGAPSDQKSEKLFENLKQIGFQCCLLSNNQYQRVSSFNEKIQVHFIENAHKPSRKNYLKAMELMGTSLENTLFVGDQLFTDVYGAKRVDTCSILMILISCAFLSSMASQARRAISLLFIGQLSFPLFPKCMVS